MALHADDRDLMNEFYATATAMLEDATELAVRGQSPHLGSIEAGDTARRLEAAVRSITVLVEAIGVIATRASE